MSKQGKTIFVADGNSILNRAFYGIRPLTTASGQPTAAIYGMLNMLWRQLESVRPDYAAVAFDVHEPTFRHLAYADYKAGRRPTPEDLLAQFAPAKECLRLLGLPVLELPGYEADDIQGTVASMAHADPGMHAYIYTGDRDLLQLIDPQITVLLAGGAETSVMNEEAFTEKFGIPPSHYVEMKAIMGDPSDHIPGVPGIGEKGAQKLIASFGTLEGVYQNLDSPEITKGTRAKLEAGRESAEQSRFLAKICTEAPLGKTLEDLRLRPIDNDGLYRLFVSLEFSGMIRKFGLHAPAESVPEATRTTQEKAEETEPECLPLTDDGVLPFGAPDYEKVSPETVLSSLSSPFAVDFGEEGYSFWDGAHAFSVPDLAGLAPLFDGSREVVAAEGKKLLHALYDAGMGDKLIVRDVLLAAYVWNAGGGKATVPGLAAQLLGQEVPEGAPAAHVLLPLWDALCKEVEKIGGTRLLFDVELPLSPVLARMEKTGFRLDCPAMEKFGAELYALMLETQQAVWQYAGWEFNVQSPKQLSEVLFDQLGLPVGKNKRNKSGYYSTDADVLGKLRYAHPIVDAVLEYRQFAKLYATYAVGLLKVADERGRIHTDFKQNLTATGRLSSAEPNLQNIPVRTKLGREMRRCFITEGEDYVFVDADYSQIELRLLAALSGDETMCGAFLRGEDIHRATAAAVFHVPEEAVTDEMRKYAKAVNFGIVYGISAYSLADDIHVSRTEAQAYIDRYYERYAGIRDYLEKAEKSAAACGYSQTVFGRRRAIPELSSPSYQTREFGKRVARNSPIQGSAADIIKVAMIRVDRRLAEAGLDARLVMQVHDELVVEAAKKDAEAVAKLLREEMEHVVDLAVPLTVDVAITSNWLE